MEFPVIQSQKTSPQVLLKIQSPLLLPVLQIVLRLLQVMTLRKADMLNVHLTDLSDGTVTVLLLFLYMEHLC